MAAAIYPTRATTSPTSSVDADRCSGHKKWAIAQGKEAAVMSGSDDPAEYDWAE